MSLPPDIKPPAQVEVFVEALGVDLALRFLLEFGGLEVTLPSTGFTRSSAVEKLLGPEKSAALLEHTHRIPKRIPKADKWIGQVWLSRGLGATEVARRLRVTEKAAREWKADLNKEIGSQPVRRRLPQPYQPDLFDQ